MSTFYPTASMHLVVMEVQAREAERQARNEGLLEQAARARRLSRTPRQSVLLYRLSLRLVAWGARLVQYGLPPYEPAASRVTLSSS
jgi:hypothetical protein